MEKAFHQPKWEQAGADMQPWGPLDPPVLGPQMPRRGVGHVGLVTPRRVEQRTGWETA